jgi:hypothetical protein
LDCDGTKSTRLCWKISECEPPLVEHAEPDISILKQAKAKYARAAIARKSPASSLLANGLPNQGFALKAPR